MILGNPLTLGGGSLLSTDAILRVQAPAGSTVTISKGSTTKTDEGHENADDNTVYDYYFIIHASQFDSVNAWTVTASLSGVTTSDSIVIDTADEYDIVITYNLVLYNEGTFTSLYTTTNLATGGTITDEADYILCQTTPPNTPYVYKRWNLVDVTPYSKLTVYMQAQAIYSNIGNTVWAKAFLTQNASLTIASQAESVQALSSTQSSSSVLVDFNFEIDISSLSGNWYIGAGIDNDGAAGSGQRKGRIINVILER